MAHVSHLFRAPQRRLPMEELEQIRALEDSGLEAARTPGPTAHGRYAGGQRDPGADGSAARNHSGKHYHLRNQREWLPGGKRLRLGEAQRKSAWRAVPCDLLEKIRPGLRRELRGRRGMLCRVIAAG